MALLLGGRINAQDGQPSPAFGIVLVHGFHNTAAIFDPLAGKLKKEGYRCFAPSLQPNDFRHGVRDLTDKLDAGIDAHFDKPQPLVFVAFSMGGLIVRDYVQNLGNAGRVCAFFMISTANRGTIWADLSPSRGVRELAPDSAFLRQLNADLTAWKNIPVHAYWTPFDLVVMPATNSRCIFGTTTRVPCPFHPWMVRNTMVMADIVAQIDELAKKHDVPAFANK